jgi:deoxyribose-phosphate aldolase
MNAKLIAELVSQAQLAKISAELPQQAMSLIDLTSLNDDDDERVIAKLCTKAQTAYGPVAAVCVYPKFIRQAKQQLSQTQISIATVANFPQGQGSLETVLTEITQAVQAGADEIDVVAPYKAYVTDAKFSALPFLQACKQACQTARLKVILETGALPSLELIAKLSQDAIDAGADFIKTSTGKIAVGAQLEAAAVMLSTIKHNGDKRVGFKASGGVRSPQQAASYLKLAELIFGKDWISPTHFRFGASALVDCLLASDSQSSY